MSNNDNEHSPNTSGTKSGADIHEYLKKGISFVATTAAQAVEAVQEVSDKLTTGGTVKMEQAVGKDAEVSATIPVGGTGEVIFSLGGSLQHCAAKAQDQRRSFKRGSKVRIVDTTNQMVFVEEF
jgi:uncharacterized metal-binding protein